jgi:hypothetical protein
MKIMVTTALFSHMTVMVAPFTQMAIMVTSAPYIRPLLTQMIIMAAVPSSHTDNAAVSMIVVCVRRGRYHHDYHLCKKGADVTMIVISVRRGSM